MRTLFAAAMLLVLTGCDGSVATLPNTTAGTTGADEPSLTVPVDLATPDKALKSYWATNDAIGDHARATQHETEAQKRYRSLLKQVMMPGLVKEPTASATEKFSRDIESVDVQSESRAVIIARIKNTSPIPLGADVEESDLEARRNGDRYKYVLEKTGADWKVAELWEWQDYLNKDWRKVFPLDDKPSVPTLTYGGQ